MTQDAKNSRYYVIGVTSFGKGCALRGWPGVYARVTRVLDWIRTSAQGSTICNPPS